jgi:RND family efflux transporter MFP subunit
MRQTIPREELFGLAWLLALLTTTAGCSQAPGAKADLAQRPVLTRVEVVRPERLAIRRSTQQPGQVEAYELTSIHAKVSGYVQKWTVDLGAKVTKGQVLAVLSVPELDAEAEQKHSMVEEAQAKLAQAKAAEEVAQANLVCARAKREEVQAGIKRVEADVSRWQAEFKRIEQLFSEHAQTGSLLDETRSKVKSSEAAQEEVHAQVRTAETAVRQSQAMLDLARANVFAATASIKVARFDADHALATRGYATIVAPYSGRITGRNVNVGDLTEEGARGKPLFSVARDDVVRITLNVPEMYADAVDPGDQAVIQLQALDGKVIQGKVSRTSWMLDAKSRTLRTEIDVPNSEGTFRPGLYVNATIVVDEHLNALTVPATAVVRAGPRTFCVTVADGRAAWKPVKLGLDDGTRVEILSGLQDNEAIVRANPSSLTDGQAVALMESHVTSTRALTGPGR